MDKKQLQGNSTAVVECADGGQIEVRLSAVCIMSTSGQVIQGV
jgi:hypothetical protein